MAQKILFVSHCILNTAAKVARSGEAGKKEEIARQQFMAKAIAQGIQLIQLPCPEFTLYGPQRWGHTKEQFDNPFFRKHCKVILEPVLVQMKAYMRSGTQNRFDVLGIIGIEGSPSCGVTRTCSGCWGGEFSGRTDLDAVLATCRGVQGLGVMMEVLGTMMEEEEIHLPIAGLNPENLQAVLAMIEDTKDAGGSNAS